MPMFHVKHRRRVDFDLEQWSFGRDAHPPWVAVTTQCGLLEYLAAGDTWADRHPDCRQAVRVPPTTCGWGLTNDELASDPQEPRGAFSRDRRRTKAPGRHEIGAVAKQLPTGDLLGPPTDHRDTIG